MTTELEPGWCSTTGRRCEHIKTEIERLQWALREIVRIAPGTVRGDDYGAILAMRMGCIAGDALRTDGQSKE
jgi:hypothetical protein